MDVFVARQPIFDRDQKVFAYELLFRSNLENSFNGTDQSLATSQVIATAFLTLGLDRVVGDRRAFLNFDREMLLRDGALLLPPQAAALEILETVPPDREVIAACRRLKEQGYCLVLDDVVSPERIEPLLELVDIIKVDFQRTLPVERYALVNRGHSLGMRVLAEKVETAAQYRQARRMGYDLFQGFFFARPVVIAGREIPAFKLHYVQILQEASRPELDYQRLEELIKQEVSLSYKLLRYINSAAFGWRGSIESVRQALVLLGESESRKWISLVALPALAQDKPEEVVVHAVVRAHFCEGLADWVGLPRRKTDLFFLGMFSMLDALLDRPLEEALEGICLAEDVRAALLGQASPRDRLAQVYALVQAYEAAHWDALLKVVGELNLPPGVAPALYIESVRWADGVFRPRQPERAVVDVPATGQSSKTRRQGAPECGPRRL